MFLVDTNVWLERLLDQEKAGEVSATIVSFDKDFDRTERGRKTPGEALAEVRERPGGQA